ncbi:MAG TPA: choice-of-anchor tandem repeat GloVer-containing protein [Candidatus Solibacter sp.]|nr:choice-of-anchor tandem repeat GloVer-containing protein [Candidatus Solibacter sp.]
MDTTAFPIPQATRQIINRFILVLAGIAMLASLATLPAVAQTESILYNFCSVQQNCGDGASPIGTLVRDSAGNLYGTTCIGGALEEGTVFKLSAEGAETVLYSFEDSTGRDGICPNAGIIRDKNGNIYGTTTGGGVYEGGIVFMLSPSLTETILYTFGRQDARTPEGPLVLDRQGNLYGVAGSGGTAKFGAVYKIAPNGTESILHSFTNSNGDGGYPNGALVSDTRGNLYGTTSYGGAYGYGTVYRLNLDGTETTLHSFGLNSDGRTPYAGVVLAKNGDLYGTTNLGGAFRVGTVFKLSPNGDEFVLHSFTPNTSDGQHPYGELLLDSAGNLYGTTEYGGTSGAGVVFEITAARTEMILHEFTGSPSDGATPFGAPIMDSAGNLYGTTLSGGANDSGTIFRITP